jgi:hypothetical protein
MKFRSEDNGNWRVYYTDSRKRMRNKLYCWQNDGSWGRTFWRFYVCSKDGEPSYSISPPDATPLPPGETSTGRALREYLATERKTNE